MEARFYRRGNHIMAKEFNAETATPAEGIVATFEFEIENAGDDEKRKKEISLNIGDAVEKKYITSEQAEKLYKKLGVPAPAPKKTLKTRADHNTEEIDRQKWELDLSDKYTKLQEALDKVANIKIMLKDARQELAQIQDAINEEVGQGSRGYSDRKRTLFDGVEE